MPGQPEPCPGASEITSEPFTSDDVCIYAAVRFDPWQYGHVTPDTYNLRGPDGQPGVASVDDDLNRITDDDNESPSARPTAVNGGYADRDGTGFAAGLEAAPGAAGVDDHANGIVDDSGEIGWAGSDDGGDHTRQAQWLLLNANIANSSTIHLEFEVWWLTLQQIVNGQDSLPEVSNEFNGAAYFRPTVHYNLVFCASGSGYGAMLWRGTDMANPDETMGPLMNTEHTGSNDNLVRFGFYQVSNPLRHIRRNRILGNRNFGDTYWVVSGDPARFYPSPSADLDQDKDVEGFDFLTFSNCYDGPNRRPQAACFPPKPATCP